MSPPSATEMLSKIVGLGQANEDRSQARNFPSWTPTSWKSKPIKQDAVYDDQRYLQKSLEKLNHLPPLVPSAEIDSLKNKLREVAQGDAFLLQGGDCAELFDYCTQDKIESKMKLLLQMSLILIWGSHKPIVRIARMAGQYAKPRSSPMEMVDGKQIPSFRGDILNGFKTNERTLDPSRLVDAYFHSAATLNFVRGSISTGFADLHRPLDWGLGHVRDPNLQKKYSDTVESISDNLDFLRATGHNTGSQELSTVDLFTSHEALLLDYEQCLTRSFRPAPESHARTIEGVEENERLFYDTSAHFIWVGDRTRQIDHAHVEFLRGIQNPIGVKVGPTTPPSDLLVLLRTLNPAVDVGKITLITRYGASKVGKLLPEHIKIVENSEYANTVVWQCDPMHGNTRSTSTGIKTRQFADILSELEQSFVIHKQQGSYLGGVHLEMTGDAVTECTGGSEGLADNDLSLNYTSFCDPRLNEKQSVELAFLIAGHLRQDRKDMRAKKTIFKGKDHLR